MNKRYVSKSIRFTFSFIRIVCHPGCIRAKYPSSSTPDDSVVVAHQMVAAAAEREREEEH